MLKEIIGGTLVVKDGPIVPVSKAVRAGDYVYVSGQLAYDDDGRFRSGTIEEETEAVLRNINKILNAADCTLADVIKCTCWLTSEVDQKPLIQLILNFFPIIRLLGLPLFRS